MLDSGSLPSGGTLGIIAVIISSLISGYTLYNNRRIDDRTAKKDEFNELVKNYKDLYAREQVRSKEFEELVASQGAIILEQKGIILEQSKQIDQLNKTVIRLNNEIEEQTKEIFTLKQRIGGVEDNQNSAVAG